MQLTQRQESFISRYLRDLSTQLDGSLSQQSRDERLRQIQSRIYRELDALPQNNISDADVMGILQRAMPRKVAPKTPESDATSQSSDASPVTSPRSTPRKPVVPPPPDDEIDAPVWLGVCAFNAYRFGAPTWTVRLFAVFLGLVTGPVAVFCYLAGFVEIYLGTEAKDRPAIAITPLVLRSIAPLAVAIAVRWGAFKLIDLIKYGHEKAFNEPFPPLEDWNWLFLYEGTFFMLLCASVIPFAILSGLPLANAWAHSLKRLTQALVALYFIALCFGIASLLVGLILHRVEPYMQ